MGPIESARTPGAPTSQPQSKNLLPHRNPKRETEHPAKDRIFDAYYRGGDSEQREKFPGLGVGLAISKKVVELHKGKIWVENKPTIGNCFAFSLPILHQRESELNSFAPIIGGENLD